MSNLKDLSLLRTSLKSNELSQDRISDFCRKLFIKNLSGLFGGRLAIQDNYGRFSLGDEQAGELDIKISVHNHNFYIDVLTGGSVGAAESYVRRDWECDDLCKLTRLMLVNREMLDRMDSRMFTLAKNGLAKIIHAFRRNSKDGSRKNIQSHYDLGNDFFESMLDDTMSYSSGIYKDDTTTLKESSIIKLDRICTQLDLKPDDHLLEIGSGWGGLAIHAAKNYGCKVTTVTISKEQFSYARDKIKAEGLDHLIDIQLKDYRDIDGCYDKLVSVEMIEAVGHHYYKDYFQTLNRLVKDDGMMLLQAITIDDRQYDQARKDVDFIKKYIFPGCCIPSISIIMEHIRKETDYQLYDVHDLTQDYARTLRDWHNNVQENKAAILQKGYTESFLRLWEFYLAYCEGGFIERAIGDVQLHFVKPGSRA